MAKRAATGEKHAHRTERRPSATTSSKPRRSSAPVLGNVYQFKLTDGRLAYLQFVGTDHRPPPGFSGFGYMVRVLPAIQVARPADPASLARQEGEQLLLFLHLPSAIRQRAIELVGHAPVPERLATLPVFKSTTIHPHTQVRTFHLYDLGNKTEKTLGTKLPRAMLDYPEIMLCTVAAIVERVELGKTHRSFVRPEDIVD